ncbi:MAG: DUF4239 domain-containing protein [Cyanobacteria bacterium SZAS LIN-5]|nr:DUF4239 domain-containing protein [Cyanobacteria bacterium SZAS LIN-5]
MIQSSIHLLLWIVGSVACAVLGLFTFEKIRPKYVMSENSEFLVSSVAIVGTLVSVLLGLLISTAADQYKDMEACVDSEATAVGEMFRLSRGLPTEKGKRLQLACIRYCDAILNDEWAAMKKGGLSDQVTSAFLELNDAMTDIKPQNAEYAGIQIELLRALRELSNHRRERIISVRSHTFAQMLPMLLICSLVLLCNAYLFSSASPSRLHIMLIALIGTVLGANFGILDLLDHPFTGAASISPEQFQINEEAMKRFLL